MRKKGFSRGVALALACMMMITGCGGGNTQPTTTTSETTTAKAENESKTETTTPQKADSKGPGYDYMASLPKLSEEKITFNLAASQEVSQNDFATMEFYKALEEATNVHIEWSLYPQASYNDQKNLMLASGEYPDGFFGYAALSMADMNQYGPMGVFIPVEDLIEQYSPNYKQRLSERPVLDGLSTGFDGHKYSWGTVNEHPNRDYPDNFYINKAWLDKLGLQVPTTMDEYYDVLTAFKTQDPNGNGQADEIPYSFLPFHHIQGYGGFFGAWGRAEAFNGPNGKVEDHYVVENDTVIYEPITEEYKNAIKGLRRFFTDGLFDQEGFVQDNAQMNGKITSTTPILGSMYIWDVGGLSEENRQQYIAIKPLKATADSPDASVHKRQNHISIQPSGLSITSQCKNPEILAQWIDLFYSDDMSVMSYYGPDKVKGIDNGVFTYDETPSSDGAPFSTFVSQIAPFDGAPKFLTFDIISNKISLETNNSKKIDTIEEFYLNAPQSVTLPSMNYTAEENEFLSSYGMSIQNYVMETQSNWLMGKSDIDQDWDGYIAQLEKMKVKEFNEMMQSIYNRTIGK